MAGRRLALLIGWSVLQIVCTKSEVRLYYNAL